jgi:hypothetical protein
MINLALTLFLSLATHAFGQITNLLGVFTGEHSQDVHSIGYFPSTNGPSLLQWNTFENGSPFTNFTVWHGGASEVYTGQIQCGTNHQALLPSGDHWVRLIAERENGDRYCLREQFFGAGNYDVPQLVVEYQHATGWPWLPHMIIPLPTNRNEGYFRLGIRK